MTCDPIDAVPIVVTKCPGDGCPVRLYCLRFTIKETPVQDWLSDVPYDHERRCCDYHLPNNKDLPRRKRAALACDGPDPLDDNPTFQIPVGHREHDVLPFDIRAEALTGNSTRHHRPLHVRPGTRISPYRRD